MAALAAYFTINVLISGLLWATDTVVLWIIGFIGLMIFLPIAVAAWIGYFYKKARPAQGKPKGNVLVIFAVCTGICLLGNIICGVIWFDTNNKTDTFGYGFIMLLIISPILLFEFIGMLAAAIVKSNDQPNNAANFAAYVNPPYNSNMYQGYPGGAYPNYQNYPNANYPYQNYPYPSGNYPNYPNDPYPNGNYPNYNNATNGYDPNYPNNNLGGR